MVRIERPAVEASIETIAVPLDLPLRHQMTIEAERLELAGPELGNVALVRLNVIADCCRRDNGAPSNICKADARAPGCFLIHAQRAVEYHLSHCVGWPRTPIVLSSSSNASLESTDYTRDALLDRSRLDNRFLDH